MDRRQHSEQWNQMLEDALNTVLNSSNSSTSTMDLSNNSTIREVSQSTSTVDDANRTPAPRTTLAPINTNTNLHSTIPSIIRPSMSNSSTSTVESTIPVTNDDDLISKFTSDWFDCMYRYHMNVRQYHQNINQFNRLSSNIYNDLSNQRRTNRINSLLESINRRHSSSPVLNVPIPPLNTATATATATAGQSTSSSSASNSIPQTIPSTVPFFTNNNVFSNMPISLQELLARSPPGQQIEIQGFTIPIMDGYEPGSTVRFPTIAQIFEATEIFTYNDDTSGRVTDTRCPITLDDFEYGEELCEIKHCHHVFKWTSLRTWFSQNTHCPVCRHDIVEIDNRA
jgi:hypothetical protein